MRSSRSSRSSSSDHSNNFYHRVPSPDLTIVNLKDRLNAIVLHFEQPAFIKDDPISIPHQFSLLQDIEIAGFFASIFAWGQRKTIINKAEEFLALMDFKPYDFILNFREDDLSRFMNFKHRTFQPDDAISFLHFLQWYYNEHSSLEEIFELHEEGTVERGLNKLNQMFIQHPATMKRSKKHLSAPVSGSACKRLNMLLRWMVRSADRGVDFGLWKKRLSPEQLIIPLDVHVFRTAHKLGLINGKAPNWKMANELTSVLCKMDEKDPVKYDFALFSMSLQERSAAPLENMGDDLL